jgi:predicted N-acetyltransferase YhbS
MRRYEPDDFMKIRDFLVATYPRFDRPINWTLERWNFSVSVARIMNGVTRQEWEDDIAIWEEDGEILAVVNSEGEARGEAFVQIARLTLPAPVLDEMFAFIEANLGEEEDGEHRIDLRIPVGVSQLEQMAEARGYTRLTYVSRMGILPLKAPFPVVLPGGLRFAYGDAVTPAEKGMAHARAFGYYAESRVHRERAPIGFHRMMQTPDYRPDLDLHVRDADGTIVAFATMWYDAQNRIGILEPVGTVPAYRKMGLGRACVAQLANQVRAAGGVEVHVGSDQPFYVRLGFEVRDKYGIWRKVVD